MHKGMDYTPFFGGHGYKNNSNLLDGNYLQKTEYSLGSLTGRVSMETRTVKPPKALPNTFRKVMPTLVVANKHSQGKKDLGDSKHITFHIAHSL